MEAAQTWKHQPTSTESFFNFLDGFTANGVPLAARRMRILPMNQLACGQ
jgi:hypothetical protein